MDKFTAKLDIAKDVFASLSITLLICSLLGVHGVWFIALSCVVITTYVVVSFVHESAMNAWVFDMQGKNNG